MLNKTSVLLASAVFVIWSRPAPAATLITFGGVSVSGQGIESSVSGAANVNFSNGEPSNYSGGSVVSGSVDGVYASPAGDTSPYLTTGIGSIDIDFASDPIKYFGLYWGSIDSYNSITLAGMNGTETYSGSQIAALDNSSANGASALYVNFFASPGSGWQQITLSSSNYAFESDNHAYETAAPEPATWGMLVGGLGVCLVALTLKRRQGYLRFVRD